MTTDVQSGWRLVESLVGMLCPAATEGGELPFSVMTLQPRVSVRECVSALGPCAPPLPSPPSRPTPSP